MQKWLRVLLASALLCMITAQAEDAYWYVNPDGGTRYHASPTCPAVGEKYRTGMFALTAREMLQSPYDQLKPCSMCGVTLLPDAVQSEQTSFFYVSPYDTGDREAVLTTGVYCAGEDMTCGIYTAWAEAGCSGTVTVVSAGGAVIHQWALQPGSQCSFYLADGMKVAVPAHCQVRSVDREARFQQTGETMVMMQQRYLVMYEIPGQRYQVTPLPGMQGEYVLCSMSADMGQATEQRVLLRDGETVTLNLQGAYDVFVEFINCIVSPSESGVG